MGIILKGIGVVVALFILVVLLGGCSVMDTKTAYTRDGINFVSRERVDENIKYEYAKPGDYREVQVPLNTIVVGASIIPEDTSKQGIQKSPTQEILPSNPNQTAPVSAFGNRIKYPYAPLVIGLLLIGGMVIFAVSYIRRYDRRQK